jgi:hypothetical protein
MTHALRLSDAYLVDDIQESPAQYGNVFSVPMREETPYEEPIANRIRRQSLMLLSAIGEEDASSEVISNALGLIKRISNLLPDTDPYVTDVGSISFDWDEDPQRQLSIMVQRNGLISYSSLLGRQILRGTAKYSGGVLPSELHRAAQQWLSYAASDRD